MVNRTFVIVLSLIILSKSLFSMEINEPSKNATDSYDPISLYMKALFQINIFGTKTCSERAQEDAQKLLTIFYENQSKLPSYQRNIVEGKLDIEKFNQEPNVRSARGLAYHLSNPTNNIQNDELAIVASWIKDGTYTSKIKELPGENDTIFPPPIELFSDSSNVRTFDSLISTLPIILLFALEQSSSFVDMNLKIKAILHEHKYIVATGVDLRKSTFLGDVLGMKGLPTTHETKSLKFTTESLTQTVHLCDTPTLSSYYPQLSQFTKILSILSDYIITIIPLKNVGLKSTDTDIVRFINYCHNEKGIKTLTFFDVGDEFIGLTSKYQENLQLEQPLDEQKKALTHLFALQAQYDVSLLTPNITPNFCLLYPLFNQHFPEELLRKNGGIVLDLTEVFEKTLSGLDVSNDMKAELEKRNNSTQCFLINGKYKKLTNFEYSEARFQEMAKLWQKMYTDAQDL